MEKKTYKVNEVIHSSHQKRRLLDQKVDMLMQSYQFSNNFAQPENYTSAGDDISVMNDAFEIDAIHRYLSDRENEDADPTIFEGNTHESAGSVRIETVGDFVSDLLFDTASEGQPKEDNEEEDDENIFFDCFDQPETAHTFKSALQELIVVDQVKEYTVEKLLNV